MKRQVPCRVPGILPLVWHGDDVAVQHVEPFNVAADSLACSDQRMSVMLGQPPVEIEIVILLGPEHPGQRLAVDATFILAQFLRSDALIEFVGVGKAACKDLIEGRRMRYSPAWRSIVNARPCFLLLELPARNGLQLWFLSSRD